MADDRDDKEKEESTSTKGGPEGGEINDSLTRSDVEAPRAPFGSDPDRHVGGR